MKEDLKTVALALLLLFGAATFLLAAVLFFTWIMNV